MHDVNIATVGTSILVLAVLLFVCWIFERCFTKKSCLLTARGRDFLFSDKKDVK